MDTNTCFTMESFDFVQDCYYSSSLWVYKQNHIYKLNLDLRETTWLLLILAGDVEICPGPNCGACLNNIKHNKQKVTCIGCTQFFHKNCINIKDFITTSLCTQCRLNHDGGRTENDTINSFSEKRGFKLLHLNVNGLFGKIDQIRDMLFSTRKNIHLFGITESHLTEIIPDSLVSIEGYRTVRKDRKTGIGGGVIVYIRDDLKWQRRFDLESDIESIVVEIFVEKYKSFIVCVMYRPPDSSLHGTKNFETCLNDFLTISSTEDKETLLLGDLNIDYNKRNDHKQLKDLFVIVGLKQLIIQFTRVMKKSKTIIDVIFTSHQNNVKETIVLPLGISDLTGVNRKINVNRYVPRRIKIRDYKNYNATRFKDDMKNSDWDSIIFKDTMNESWDAFKSRILEIINIHVPLKEISIRGKSCPWLSGEIKTKMRERDHFLRKARKYNNSFDWESYKRIRNKVTTLIR